MDANDDAPRPGRAGGVKDGYEATSEDTTGRRGRVLAALNAFFAREARRSLERRIKRQFDPRLSSQLDAAIAREESS